MDCTIEELNANRSNGCRRSTFEFLEEDAYQPEDNPVYEIGYADSDTVKINGEFVNPVCLELVRRCKGRKKDKKGKLESKKEELKRKILEMLEDF